MSGEPSPSSATAPAQAGTERPVSFVGSLGVAPMLDFDLHTPHPVGGEPAGTVVYLHGFGGDKAQLEPLAELLTPAGWVAFRPSLRGHGRSPAPPWGYSVLDFAADVHRLADLLTAPLLFVGYSLGGLLGSLSAVTWARTDTVGLVVIDQSYAAHPDRMVRDDQAEGRYLRWMYDFQGLIADTPVPTRIVLARESHMVQADERRFIERLVREGRMELEHIEGAHADCLADTQAVHGACRDFVERVTGTGERP